MRHLVLVDPDRVPTRRDSQHDWRGAARGQRDGRRSERRAVRGEGKHGQHPKESGLHDQPAALPDHPLTVAPPVTSRPTPFVQAHISSLRGQAASLSVAARACRRSGCCRRAGRPRGCGRTRPRLGEPTRVRGCRPKGGGSSLPSDRRRAGRGDAFRRDLRGLPPRPRRATDGEAGTSCLPRLSNGRVRPIRGVARGRSLRALRASRGNVQRREAETRRAPRLRSSGPSGSGRLAGGANALERCAGERSALRKRTRRRDRRLARSPALSRPRSAA